MSSGGCLGSMRWRLVDCLMGHFLARHPQLVHFRVLSFLSAGWCLRLLSWIPVSRRAISNIGIGANQQQLLGCEMGWWQGSLLDGGSDLSLGLDLACRG